MINASPALKTLLLDKRQFVCADLLTIIPIAGAAMRHTNFDVDVSIDGYTWLHDGLTFERGGTRISRGIEVDTNEFTLIPGPDYAVNGVPFLAACTNGLLDGALVTLERAIMPTAGDVSSGRVWRFTGSLAEMDIVGSSVRATGRSMTEKLNIKWPRNSYNPGCVYTLYDAGCGVNRDLHRVSSATAAGSTVSVIQCALAQAAGHFALGLLQFTSGANNGSRRSIKTYVPGALTLSYPLRGPVAAGDTFYVWPGCDKTRTTCDSKFANLPRFRGFPYVPPPETAI